MKEKAQVGDKMNVIKDVKFTGRILDQVNNAVTFVKTLGQDALFHTIPEYPDFCWTVA